MLKTPGPVDVFTYFTMTNRPDKTNVYLIVNLNKT